MVVRSCLKMKNPSLVIVLLVCSLWGNASSQCLSADDNPSLMHQNFVQVLEQSRLDFAFETLKKTIEFEAVENIFYSPHSLHEALTLAYFGARGKTEEGLRRALHIPEHYSKGYVQRFYDVENSMRKFTEAAGNFSTNYEFKTANKLWVTNERKIRDCMLDLFGTQLEHVDFKVNPEAVRVKVNDWASNQTKGHINDLIPTGGVTEDSDLILANAVYFKGLWKSKFDPANSKKDNFHTNGSKISKVMFMKQKGTFSHVVSEEIGAHILQLPYKGDEISMYVLLPPFSDARNSEARSHSPNGSNHDAIRQLIDRVTGPSQAATELRDILEEGMPAREVEVSLPKFSIDKELPVGQLLNALGAGDLLTDAADLRGLLADGEPTLHLGDAVHRAVVEVTEEGTTATAATALFSFRSSRPAEPAIFNADHPFLYFIYNKLTHSVLFAGVYRSPPSSQTPITYV